MQEKTLVDVMFICLLICWVHFLHTSTVVHHVCPRCTQRPWRVVSLPYAIDCVSFAASLNRELCKMVPCENGTHFWCCFAFVDLWFLIYRFVLLPQLGRFSLVEHVAILVACFDVSMAQPSSNYDNLSRPLWTLETIPICSMVLVYVPTFGWFLGQMLVNIPAPWSIWDSVNPKFWVCLPCSR